MSGLPVITAEEMRKLEARAIQAGDNEQTYMENAGKGIANIVEQFLWSIAEEVVHLLIGKGNKGGDAYTAGIALLKKGFSVFAHPLFPSAECSPLSQLKMEEFEQAGGKFKQELIFEQGIIIDGLLGTGFKGAVEGKFAEVITAANRSGLPIFAIDIPSGLNGNTGEVETVAINADTTLFLGLPKLGFFLKEGWNHVGHLDYVDFGLPLSLIEKMTPHAYLVASENEAPPLPKIIRNRHKYQVGYVLAIAGSKAMPGAALLSSLAALKAGAGIVRLFSPPDMEESGVAPPYELIKESWDLEDASRIFEEEKRAKALLIGPGCGRSSQTEKAIKSILAKTKLPTVIDADALYFLAMDPKMALPKQTILTPHHQEMQRLIDTPPTYENCQQFADTKQLILVLKGAPTVIFHPKTKPVIVSRGDPGIAKAGTGDVLTGIIAALLAQGLAPQDAAILGVFLHGLAGESAAARETSYCVLATDLITHLPEAFAQALQRRTI